MGGETTEKDHLSILERFPELSSFPFNDYQFEIEEADGVDLDPIILRETQSSSKPELIKFYYEGSYNRMMISMYSYDVAYLIANSDKVKKLDEPRGNLDQGLDSIDPAQKIEGIKEGKKFTKGISISMVANELFSGILDDLLKKNKIELSPIIVRNIKSMKPDLFEEAKFDDLELDIINTFYDLHLHYYKIILGIVICSKIY